MANIEVIAQLVPKNSGDFPVVEDTHIKGSWRAVATIVDRDAIPSLRRKDGMVVYVASTSSEYQLGSGLTNADWTPLVDIVLDANLSPLNRNMQALTTMSDGNLACVTALLATPPANGWVQVQINGLSVHVGNGTKTGVSCYFSNDGGVTARATGLVAGDLLYWNGSVAGYQLDAAIDRIDFLFEAL